jgi:hypothetical protein
MLHFTTTTTTSKPTTTNNSPTPPSQKKKTPSLTFPRTPTSTPPKMPPYQTTVTPIPDQLTYDTLISASTGKIILACYWPEDKTSRILINQLTKRLPDIQKLGVVGVYSLDVYSLPTIAEGLDVTFVPTLMWWVLFFSVFIWR